MRKEWRVPSDPREVQKTARRVLEFLKPLRLPKGVQFDIRLCLEEALVNAMKHGHQFRREMPVRLEVAAGEREIRFLVEDKGQGFNPTKVGDCTRERNLLKEGGRGVFLIRQLMDEVRYNKKGNGLLMVKSLSAQKAALL